MLCAPTRGISIARSIHIRNLPHRKSIVLAFIHQYRSFSVSMSNQAENRSYSDAIELLNSCQSNAATIEAIRKSGGKLNQYAIPEMIEYLRRIGYRPEDLNSLNVVHITGTKGKGSTSAFVERICRGKIQEEKAGSGEVVGEEGKGLDLEGFEEDEREWVGGIGLYTSPHLCAVRERIRINGHPLPEKIFAKYFFQVWDRLSSHNASSSNNSNSNSQSHALEPIPDPHVPQDHYTSIPEKPVYFRFLTLLSFHVFLSLKIKLTVLEVGMGGTYDSTNVVPRPLVTGVTALGLDHTFMLGDTVEEIARNKGGIFKEGVPALAVVQEKSAKRGEGVLKDRAEELEASSFELVPVYPELKSIKLGLPGSHQVVNASLAVAMCKTLFSSPDLPPSLAPYHESASTSDVPPSYIPYLEKTRWPGRCQTVIDPLSDAEGNVTTTWFLDGAHTVESLTSCGEWVYGPDGMDSTAISSSTEGTPSRRKRRVLIFNCTSGRSAYALLGALLDAGKKATGKSSADVGSWFDRVIFCTNVTYVDGHFKGDLTSKAIDPNDLSALATQHALSAAWSELVPTFSRERVHVVPSIQHAVNIVRETGKAKNEDVQVLVAGSLHLVGGTMEVAGLAERALSVA